MREALAGRVAGDGPIGRRVEALLAERHLGARACCSPPPAPTPSSWRCSPSAWAPGRRSICPSFTFVSSANAVLRVGARPVFAEIEETTLGLDPGDVERRLTPRTAAIIPVHYAGVAPDMEALLDLARRRRLLVVEDAAQGLGSTWRSRALGTIGDAGCLSFHETKNVTCGEGGALVVSDPEVACRAEIAREKGTNRAAFFRGEVDKYTWVAEGSSYVLSDLLAAVLARPAGQARHDPGAAGVRRGALPRGPRRLGRGARRAHAPRAPGAHREPPPLLPPLPGRKAARRGPAPPARAGHLGDLPLRPAALRPPRPRDRHRQPTCR